MGCRGALRPGGCDYKSRAPGLGSPDLQRIGGLAESGQSLLDAPVAWNSETARARSGRIRDASTDRTGACRVFSLLAVFTDHRIRPSNEIERCCLHHDPTIPAYSSRRTRGASSVAV